MLYRILVDGFQTVFAHIFVFQNSEGYIKQTIFDPIVDEHTIWMLGPSIIKHAQVESVLRPGGSNLNLERINVSLWWQGYRGVQLIRVIEKLKMLKQVGPSPKALFVSTLWGGDDIGKQSIRKIRLAIKQLLQYISQQFPNVHIIWFLILPRISWCYSQNSNAMEKPENGLFLSLNLDCVRLEVPLFTTLTF